MTLSKPQEGKSPASRAAKPGLTQRIKPRVKYSFLKILTGSDLSRRRLALMVASGSRPGPVVWLTGCAHGDEVGGMIVIQDIFRRLRRAPLRMGELRAFPLMNPLGFEIAARHVALTGDDLNRSFPGNAHGSLGQRIAAIIFEQIIKTKPAVVLDLHNDWRSSIPYVVLDPPCGAAYREPQSITRQLARNTGLPLVEESPNSIDAQLSPRTLSGSLIRRGIPAMTLELGESYVVNETNVDFGVRAIWQLLARLDMVPAVEPGFELSIPKECRRRFLTYSDGTLSSSSGIIRFAVKPGDLVDAGQPVAKIYNAFGKLLETIISHHRGMVLGRTDSSVAFPGVPIIALGILPS